MHVYLSACQSKCAMFRLCEKTMKHIDLKYVHVYMHEHSHIFKVIMGTNIFVTMAIAHRFYHHAIIYHIMKTYSSPHFYDVKVEVARATCISSFGLKS